MLEPVFQRVVMLGALKFALPWTSFLSPPFEPACWLLLFAAGAAGLTICPRALQSTPVAIAPPKPSFILCALEL